MTAEKDPDAKYFIVCVNHRIGKPACAGGAIADALETELRQRQLAIPVERTICFGACEQGPNVRLAPGGRFYHQVTVASVAELVDDACRFAGNPATHAMESSASAIVGQGAALLLDPAALGASSRRGIDTADDGQGSRENR